MTETKAVVVPISIILLAAATFCIYEAHTEIKEGHHSKIKRQGHCQIEYKKFCLNDGDCYHLLYEDIVGCNCTWLYGGR